MSIISLQFLSLSSKNMHKSTHNHMEKSTQPLFRKSEITHFRSTSGVFLGLSSRTVKMRAVLLVCVGLLLLLLHANGDDISREEYLRLKRHLKRVNKPAVKSIKTKYGDIFDCVDIYKQLAFDHPLLKNHTLRMRPSSLPKEREINSPSDDEGNLMKQIREDMKGGCPDGTVPVRRTRMQDLLRAPSLYLHGKKYAGNVTYAGDSIRPQVVTLGHHYAIIRARGRFFGTKVGINVWNVPLAHEDMFSLVQFWVMGGPRENLNSIESGWTISPSLYGDQRTRFFTFWTGDGYTHTGCYNMICTGYVHLSSNFPLGMAYPQTSVYNGPQMGMVLQTYRDPRDGRWWLLWGEENGILGYFPGELFPLLGRCCPATVVEWGGETFTPGDVPPYPPMGSGHMPFEGGGKASYLRWIRVYDTDGDIVDAPLDTETVEDKPRCYLVDDPRQLFGGQVGRAIYYGGPGGTC